MSTHDPHRESKGLMLGVLIGGAMWLAAALIGIYLAWSGK